VLGYRNHENMAKFSDATVAFLNDPNKNAANCPSTAFSYDSNNDTAPDLCWVRRPQNKLGIGLNIEQQVSSDIGLFFRGMYSDGRTEVFSYTSADRSMNFGTLVKGERWYREKDVFGIGYARSWISNQHAAFLNLGGVDGFIGDGKLNYRPEQGLNLFYSVNLYSSIWFTGDYQHIVNPAYNADRGPVDMYGLKMHVEF
jgi:carbohydrate-selective porin OprB